MDSVGSGIGKKQVYVKTCMYKVCIVNDRSRTGRIQRSCQKPHLYNPQGAVVAVKRIHKNKITLNRGLLLELKRVRHPENSLF